MSRIALTPDNAGTGTFTIASPNSNSDRTLTLPDASGEVVINPSLAGMVATFAMNSPPAGWLKANGQAVSRTTYAALFSAIGTTFGVGDGSTTFNLPDLRGEFMRGWDDGRGIDSGRAFGSAQSFAIQNITGTADFVANGSTGNQIVSSASGSMSIASVAGGDLRTTAGAAASTGRRLTLDASTQVQTAAETRPRNIALLACIKF
jgi:microcystin-dependent protein